MTRSRQICIPHTDMYLRRVGDCNACSVALTVRITITVRVCVVIVERHFFTASENISSASWFTSASASALRSLSSRALRFLSLLSFLRALRSFFRAVLRDSFSSRALAFLFFDGARSSSSSSFSSDWRCQAECRRYPSRRGDVRSSTKGCQANQR